MRLFEAGLLQSVAPAVISSPMLQVACTCRLNDCAHLPCITSTDFKCIPDSFYVSAAACSQPVQQSQAGPQCQLPAARLAAVFCAVRRSGPWARALWYMLCSDSSATSSTPVVLQLHGPDVPPAHVHDCNDQPSSQQTHPCLNQSRASTEGIIQCSTSP